MTNDFILAPISLLQGLPVIQYADDTVLIMHACSAQLRQLKNLLMHFTTYNGLRVNYDKHVMVPINTSQAKNARINPLHGVKDWFFSIRLLGATPLLLQPK